MVLGDGLPAKSQYDVLGVHAPCRTCRDALPPPAGRSSSVSRDTACPSVHPPVDFGGFLVLAPADRAAVNATYKRLSKTRLSSYP